MTPPFKAGFRGGELARVGWAVSIGDGAGEDHDAAIVEARDDAWRCLIDDPARIMSLAH